MIPATHTYNLCSGSEAYVQLCRDLLDCGQPVTARGMPTHEFRSVTVCIADPAEAHVLRTARKPSLKIAATEAMHLIGGISSLEQLDLASGRRFSQFADRGRLRGAYGPRAHLQLLMAERLLQEDPGTRQAGVSIWNGRETSAASKDVPCTTSLHFWQRDGCLELDVVMRSNDILLGFPIDIMVFSALHRVMAQALLLPVGMYRHHAASMHAYDKDLDTVEVIARTGVAEKATGMGELPLPVPYFELESVPGYSLSAFAARARRLCLRPIDDGFHDQEWLIQHVPCLGPGWDFCPVCRYVVKSEAGCTECAIDERLRGKPLAPGNVVMPSADELRKHTGNWVGIRDGEVIASEADISAVVGSLRERGIAAQSVFRVSEL